MSPSSTQPAPVSSTSVLFHVEPNYRKVTAWCGDPKTNQRVSVHTCTPKKGLYRYMRFEVIQMWLFDRFHVPSPVYKPSEREKKEWLK